MSNPNDLIIDMLAKANSLAKDLRKAASLATDIANQRAAIAASKEAVTRALDGDGDADAAYRAFKSANNKLDRLLEQRENFTVTLPQNIADLRELLNDLTPVAE